jgi:hypothetical protein
MIFPYSFLDLVIQLGRYHALSSGYNDAIEKALGSLSLSVDRVSEIRSRAKVQRQYFTFIGDIFLYQETPHVGSVV